MTQRSASKRQTRPVPDINGLKLESTAELIIEHLPPDSDSAFGIINGGLSLLQSKCLWDRLTDSETFPAAACDTF